MDAYEIEQSILQKIINSNEVFEENPDDTLYLVSLIFLGHFDFKDTYLNHLDVLYNLYRYKGLQPTDEDEQELIQFLNKVCKNYLENEEEEAVEENIDTYSVQEDQHGFIYVLINSSLKGMVKIGKTTRDPMLRVKELSSATGVPTPFELVYKEEFSNCNAAEKIIHNYLEDNGYRVANNREFFEIPVYEAIPLIQNLKPQIENEANFTSPSNTKTFKESEIVQGLVEHGYNLLHGDTDTLIDIDEGIKTLERAIDLGSAEACKNLADFFLYDDPKKALKYYTSGSKLNGYFASLCLGKMAEIYSGFYDGFMKKGELFNSHNCIVTWNKFFDTIIIDENDNSFDKSVYLIKVESTIERYFEFYEKYDLTISEHIYEIYAAVKDARANNN